jgi:putative cardiolipin synthase
MIFPSAVPASQDLNRTDKSSHLVSTALIVIFLLAGCSSLPPNENRITSTYRADTADTGLGGKVQPMVDAHPEQSGFHILSNGMDAFTARARLISVAEKSIDTQYYIWHDDLTGRALHELLLEAADRGVRVRLLLDDLDTAGKESILRNINAHPNIEIRLYNPFANRDMRSVDFIVDTKRVNRRMHIKTLTVDNQATIFGGRNIGNEYFDAGPDVAFSDVDALAIGPIVDEVSSQFDLYWNSQWVYPLAAFKAPPLDVDSVSAYRAQSRTFLNQAKDSEYGAALSEADLAFVSSIAALEFSWSDWFLSYDHPSKVDATEVTKDTHLAPGLKNAMDKVENELIIVSPYFVPGEDFTAYLTGLVDKGIRVRILTNSLSANDVSLVHAGYMRYRKDLVAGGVELYEYKSSVSRAVTDGDAKRKKKRIGASRASLHAKFFGFDQQYIFIGSFNLDFRSVELNAELGAYFESHALGQELSTDFDNKALDRAYQLGLDDAGKLFWVTRENGEEKRFDKEPGTTAWTRFKTRFLSIIVPEGML